jgi:hypothetical protein
MLRKVIVNFFIISCCVCWITMTSIQSSFQSACLGVIQPYVNYLGLMLWFNMFGPEPPVSNHAVGALTTFANGTHKMSKLEMLSDYRDNLWLNRVKCRQAALNAWLWHPTQYQELHEAAARFIARLNTNSENQPATIDLYDYNLPIEMPGDGKGLSSSGAVKPRLILHYLVQPEDLK